jgi:hypothetical protein
MHDCMMHDTCMMHGHIATFSLLHTSTCACIRPFIRSVGGRRTDCTISSLVSVAPRSACRPGLSQRRTAPTSVSRNWPRPGGCGEVPSASPRLNTLASFCWPRFVGAGPRVRREGDHRRRSSLGTTNGFCACRAVMQQRWIVGCGRASGCCLTTSLVSFSSLTDSLSVILAGAFRHFSVLVDISPGDSVLDCVRTEEGVEQWCTLTVTRLPSWAP